ncbi:MAG: M48 family metallopeptidase [Nitrospiria bacterium]
MKPILELADSHLQLTWEGDYLDGWSANRQRVGVYLEKHRISIKTESGEVFYLPYQELRQTQGFYEGEPVRFEWDGDTPRALVIQDSEFLPSLHRNVGNKASHIHNPANRSLRLKLTFAAAVSSIVIAASLYLWGIPTIASLATHYVPVSWEKKLGAGVMSYLAPPEKLCKNKELRQSVQLIFSGLIPVNSDIPYSFEISIIDSRIVNAFAAPGGYIGLYHGLIEQTKSPEELAGVLAHEVQHIVKRHSTRALLQQASSNILMSALTGDLSGAQAFGLASADNFFRLKNSREAEREADEEGMKMILEAGIDPEGMIHFFDHIKEYEENLPGIYKYLSSHPGTRSRVSHLNILAKHAPEGKTTKLIGNDLWDKIKKSC